MIWAIILLMNQQWMAQLVLAFTYLHWNKNQSRNVMDKEGAIVRMDPTCKDIYLAFIATSMHSDFKLDGVLSFFSLMGPTKDHWSRCSIPLHDPIRSCSQGRLSARYASRGGISIFK